MKLIIAEKCGWKYKGMKREFLFLHATALQRAEAFCRTVKPEMFEKE